MMKFYKIPDWHDIYALYENYLKNREKTKMLVLKFMKKYNLHSSYVMVGYDIKKGMKKGEQTLEEVPFFRFKDNDPKIEERDKRTLNRANKKVGKEYMKHRDNDAYVKKDSNSFYGIRKNSPIMIEWTSLLRSYDNFKILDVPNIMSYLIFNEKDKTVRIQKVFEKHGDDLYLCIICNRDFIVSEDFIEIKEKKASEYFDMKVLKGE